MPAMADPLQLVTAKTDAEAADEIKRALAEAYQPILAILERARAQGFVCNVQVGSPGPLSPISILALTVMKQF